MRHEGGPSFADLDRELGVTPAPSSEWRKKYAGVETSELKRLKTLEAENAKLKRMYGDQAIQFEGFHEAVGHGLRC